MAIQIISKTCKKCRNLFETKRIDAHFCDWNCFQAFQRIEKVIKNCEYCDKEFEPKDSSYVKKLKSKYCSRVCKETVQTIPVEERFLKYVEKQENGCWVWTGKTKDKNGYGCITHNKKQIKAHRLSYQMANPGKIAELEKSCVLHRCDNPPCVNPSHLFLGTTRENTLDMLKKGRQARGEHQGLAKLNEDKVREIRQLAVKTRQSYKKLADKFGVNYSSILRAAKQETWKHID